MRKKGKVKAGILILAVAGLLAMTACQGSTSKLPDLSNMGNVVSVSREEGSGTRMEFETLLDTSEAGAKVVATSTDEVQKQVGNDKNAVGYMAYSGNSLSGQTKMIKVDGQQLSTKSIQKGKYPLCRNYYIAYKGELSAVGEDFLAYMMQRGQKIVEKNCVPVKKASTFLSDKSKGTLTIKGSTSAAPLIKEMIKDYQTYNPNAKIRMISSDSSMGLTAAIRGECDLAVSSRELKDYESELLTSKAFAKDGIAIVVNKANPVEDLTVKQIKKLYDGDCKKWSDLQ